MFEPTGNKYVNQEVKKVVNGQGTPREEDGSQKNWIGSIEWDVPQSKNIHDRILERTNKDGSKSYGVF